MRYTRKDWEGSGRDLFEHTIAEFVWKD